MIASGARKRTTVTVQAGARNSARSRFTGSVREAQFVRRPPADMHRITGLPARPEARKLRRHRLTPVDLSLHLNVITEKAGAHHGRPQRAHFLVGWGREQPHRFGADADAVDPVHGTEE